MYISRHAEKLVKKMTTMFKVVLITGPRQVGKTTMLRHLLRDEYNYVTLDDVNQLSVAKSDAKLFFMNNPGKLIIDEVQNAPELFSEIKRIVDDSDEKGTIILTGSQTFSLMSNVSESLAGRVGILELSGLSLREIRGEEYTQPAIPDENYINDKRVKTSPIELWEIIHRGSMPGLYENRLSDWNLFYASYIKTYLERDVRMIVNVQDLTKFSNFMIALAARTANILNYNVIANEIGVDVNTVKKWVSVLETSGLVTLLQPFSNNRLKRVIKTPMLYFMDTGLVCFLLKWLTPDTLRSGAMSGQIFETYAVSEVIKSFKNNGVLSPPVYFYRDRDMKEIDLIVENAGVLYPVEIKKTASPTLSMGKNLKILEKAEGYEVGQKTIVCLIDKKMFLSKDIVAYPVTGI